MRWKEHFLVPDHRVRTISGASFEGFYYICFNQCQGTVSGIYFHAKSEKYGDLKNLEELVKLIFMQVPTTRIEARRRSRLFSRNRVPVNGKRTAVRCDV
jgi:hypothetical protein